MPAEAAAPAQASRASSVPSRNDGSQPARCLNCGTALPCQPKPGAGRKPRYCTNACKARAYRARQAATRAKPAQGITIPSSTEARYARATEIRPQISELVTILADTASGPQALFESAASSKPVRTTIRKLNKLTSELAALAAARPN